jgi:hypothetical protein
LDVPGDVERARGELTAAVFSNGHDVALTATARSSGEPRATLLLNSGARKSLAQNAACAPTTSRPAAPAKPGLGAESFSAGLVCTACTP